MISSGSAHTQPRAQLITTRARNGACEAVSLPPISNALTGGIIVGSLAPALAGQAHSTGARRGWDLFPCMKESLSGLLVELLKQINAPSNFVVYPWVYP